MPSGAKFRVERTGVPELDAHQQKVAATFDQLEGARRGNLEGGLVIAQQPTLQMGEALSFFYRGDQPGTWTLPRASFRGAKAVIIHVINFSAYPLEVKPTGSETVAGTTGVTVVALSGRPFYSDGDAAWVTVP